MKKIESMSRAERHALRLSLREAASSVHTKASAQRKVIRDAQVELDALMRRQRDIYASLELLDSLDE